MATLDSSSRTKREAATVRAAILILEQEMKQYGPNLSNGGAVRDYLRLQLEREERELFGCLFLSAQNELIEWNPMFYGTLTQTSVFPREILKRALLVNANSVILAHNHPSGLAEPSQQDKYVTKSLIEALALVDIRVLDHFIVANGSVFSFAEHRLLYRSLR